METIEEKVTHKIKFNYWIYLLTGIALLGGIFYFTGRDSMTGAYDYSKLIITEAVIILSSLIAWAIGKRYSLNYVWVCGLAGLYYIVVTILIQFVPMMISIGLSNGIFEALYVIPRLFSTIPLFFFAVLVLGGLILVISFPFQYLYSKLRNQIS